MAISDPTKTKGFTMNIELPEKFEPEFLPAIKDTLNAHQCAETVNIDFSRVQYSKPMSMLVAGSYIRQFVRKRKSEQLNTTGSGVSDANDAHRYLKHLGFFDFVKLGDLGNRMGEASGSRTYQPIREIKREELEHSITETGETLYDAIMEKSAGIANVLANGGSNLQMRNAFGYTIREIIRNTFEHSEADSCFICAQKWWDGKAEIAIIDEGIGITTTLQRSYSISENEALTEAIKPGITRTHNMTEEENVYGNSGYGLYALSQLGSSFGWFRLGSGKQSLVHQKQEIKLIDLPYEGTYVGLHLDKIPSNFAGTLQDIISEGEEEAGTEGRLSAASEQSRQI